MFGIRKLVKEHLKHNIMITGEKGSGKDVLTGNIVARIPHRYVSNVDYTLDDRFIPLDLSKFNVGGNIYENFISGCILPYKYPYEDGVNVYISDCGNYFPAQYDSQLDKKYGYFATWSSLQRQLGDSCLHVNTQAYGRVWKKIREQATEYYIRCDKCLVLFGNHGEFAKFVNRVFKRDLYKFGGIVFATYYFYDKASSCENRVKPCRVRKPFMANKEQRLHYSMHMDNFYNQYGTVEKKIYICVNKSKHDTRAFKCLLENGGGVK